MHAGVYDTDRRAFMTSFTVTPGEGLGNGSPYGSMRAVYAEAKAEWKTGSGGFVSLLAVLTDLVCCKLSTPGSAFPT